MTTPLKKIILDQINRFGPLPVSEYMTLCLLHPEHGYYTTRDALGAKGDFTTAPEISQMFGELLGLSLAQAWMDQGSPNPFVLAELGPGNGTLMADILRATKAVPDFHASMQLTLIEASSEMQQRQAETLQGYSVSWLDNLSDAPELPLFVIGNEFFDCLPIKQFRRTKEGWQEQMVGCEGDTLHFLLGKATKPEAFGNIEERPINTMVEVSSASAAIAAATARHINQFGGAAIFIDYGAWDSDGDTLQALKAHQKVDVLDHCGQADLTAHVCFKDLHSAVSPFAQVSDMIPQGVLLERLGITARAQSLATQLTGDALENHITAHRRLTHPDEMGHLFNAIAIVPKGAMLPAGF